MLVEDQPAIRHWLSWCFRSLSGYAPLLVYSRSQARAWLGAAETWERIPDVVLIDVSVPGQTLAPLMDALRASRTEAEHAPLIIGMTTMPKRYYLQMPEGIQALLYKPFPFRLLCTLLAECLDQQG